MELGGRVRDIKPDECNGLKVRHDHLDPFQVGRQKKLSMAL